MKADVIAVYGQIKLKQNTCKICKSNFFILNKEDAESELCSDCRVEYGEVIKIRPKQKTKILYHIPLFGRQYIPKKIRLAVYERDNYTCVYCDRNLYDDFKSKTGKIAIDHFVPYMGRGEDEIENLFTVCKRCNSAKYSKLFGTVQEVREYIKGLRDLPDDEENLNAPL